MQKVIGRWNATRTDTLVELQIGRDILVRVKGTTYVKVNEVNEGNEVDGDEVTAGMSLGKTGKIVIGT